MLPSLADLRASRKPTKLALSSVKALIVDGDKHEAAITAQMLRGFGLSSYAVAENSSDAMQYLTKNLVDLCVVEYNLSEETGADLTRWIRRQPSDVRHVAIVVFTGHTRLANVLAARDGGANSVVKKPISAAVLFDHIAWAATGRPFVETDTFIGPDRRYKNIGPPEGRGRRETDLSGKVGDATEPNMSQAEIDMMVRPTKVVIS